MAKNPDLDEPTRRIAERLLNTPPKPHADMKLGKSKAKASNSPSAKNERKTRPNLKDY